MDLTEFYLPDTIWLRLRPPIISYRSIFKVQLLPHFELNWCGMIDDPNYSVMDFITRYIAQKTKLTFFRHVTGTLSVIMFHSKM